jgi:8-oxo-dGTP diphosphatase
MIAAYKKNERFLIAVDCIIFGFDGKSLKALLIKRRLQPEKGKWSLMGGFVNKDEGVDDAAKRILKELTGLSEIYMEQLHCFGDVTRDKGGRVVSIAYFALIREEDYSSELTAKHDAHWVDMDELPPLIFDHDCMIKMARERLQQKAANHPIGFALLPNQFTLPQLQMLYEAIYSMPIDKRNFVKKIQSLQILNKLEKKDKQSSRKGAYYYVFNKKKYAELDKTGIKIV